MICPVCASVPQPDHLLCNICAVRVQLIATVLMLASILLGVAFWE